MLMRLLCRCGWVAGLGVATFVAVLLLPSVRARAATPLSWGSPVRIDRYRPFAFSGGLNTVSCPSSRLCVAVDSGGGVIASTDPGGPASAWKLVHDGATALS